jgi:hypothetical protein
LEALIDIDDTPSALIEARSLPGLDCIFTDGTAFSQWTCHVSPLVCIQPVDT